MKFSELVESTSYVGSRTTNLGVILQKPCKNLFIPTPKENVCSECVLKTSFLSHLSMTLF